MKKLKQFMYVFICLGAIAEAIMIIDLSIQHKNYREANRVPVTIYMWPHTIEASEDVEVISDLKSLEIEHFERDSFNLVLIRYRK